MIARPPLARGPVLAAMVVLGVVLTVFSGRYGPHRDELYFRMLRPAWGYVDQPPLTPLLARAMTHLADTTWALRIPATVFAVASVPVVVLVTRELGGGRGAQTLCAWGYAFASSPLVFGHVLLTSSLDVAVWPAVALLIIRGLLRPQEPRWWWAAGIVVGLSTYNKLLVVVLLVSLGAGILASGPRRVLRSRPVLTGVALALVIGLPNAVYQLAHGLPQLDMGRALSEHNASEVRRQMWPLLLLLVGPPQVPIWIAGLVALWRRPEWRAVRGVAVGFAVLLALVFAMGSQSYYPAGLLVVLFAAGCVPAAEWITRGRGRRALVAAGLAINAAVAATIALPLVPLASLGDTPVPDVNQAARDQVGWPAYVAEIRAVANNVPSRGTIVLASNYGEAGAIARYGRDLPPVYSAQNSLWDQARPPDSARTAVVVGAQLPEIRALFASCQTAGRLDNHAGVDNEEQGQPIAICRDLHEGWRAAWPQLRHLD